MQQLVFTSFENNQLPDNWFTDSLCMSFADNTLLSGPATEVQMVLPGFGWKTIRVEVEVDAEDGRHIYCEQDCNMRLDVDLKAKYARHSAFRYQLELEKGTASIPTDTQTHIVTFEFDNGKLRALVDGVEVISAADDYHRQPANRLKLGFINDCKVRSIRVYGDGPLEKPQFDIPAKANDDYCLEVCVDPFDDLIPAPFTRNTFDELFAELKSWGTKRVQWIYYGKKEDGWWDYSTWGVPANAAKTCENVGDIFKTAVEAAHDHGIEIYGLLKPFDMGLRFTYGDGTQEEAQCGRVKMVGGSVGWVAKFPAEHRELMMSRKLGVYGDAENDAFNRIDLVKDDDAACAFSADDIEILISEDNVTYIPYHGPVTKLEIVEDYPLYVHTSSGPVKTDKTVPARVFRFSDLKITQEYLALAVQSREGSFNNNPMNLIHVFGEKGEERKLTYGYVQRINTKGESLPFREYGVEFDTNPMVTAVCAGGYDAVRAYFPFDSGNGFLAVARGKDRYPIAAMSPAFDETRKWWLSWVRDILDAGADGVEMRVRNHHSILGWAEYGFEEPVVSEYKARYGVDLLASDNFDMCKLRRLRGEYYTNFYREARELINYYGKKMGLHVSPTMDTDPEAGGAMEIHWDGEEWLSQGLADSVTMKEIWPDTRLGYNVLSYTRIQNIPAVFCPYANQYWTSPPYTSLPGGEKVIDGMIQAGKNGGFDGYQFYECAAVIHAAPDGHITMSEPALREVFKRHFVK